MIVCYIIPTSITSLQECSLVHSMSTMTSAQIAVQLGAGGLIVIALPFSMVLGSRISGIVLGFHNIGEEQRLMEHQC